MDMSCVDRQDVLLAIIEAADARGLKRSREENTHSTADMLAALQQT